MTAAHPAPGRPAIGRRSQGGGFNPDVSLVCHRCGAIAGGCRLLARSVGAPASVQPRADSLNFRHSRSSRPIGVWSTRSVREAPCLLRMK
jgi:hypothetical protein